MWKLFQQPLFTCFVTFDCYAAKGKLKRSQRAPCELNAIGGAEMLRWIVALVLIGHGLGHSIGVLASWTSIPSGLTGGHWLLSDNVTMDSTVGRVFGILWLVTLVGTTASGIGLLANQEWWQPLAVASSVLSLIAIVPWLNTMPTMSAIGAVAVDLAVLIVLLGPWGQPVVDRIR
jgi:hypothetical protein